MKGDLQARAGHQKPARQRELLSGERTRGPQHQVKPAASTHEQSGGRAAHVTVKATSSVGEPKPIVDSGGVGGAARVSGEARNTRDPSAQPLSGAGGSYKPMAKSSAVQRESEGIVVPQTVGEPTGTKAVKNNAAGGKGPCGDQADVAGKYEGMVQPTTGGWSCRCKSGRCSVRGCRSENRRGGQVTAHPASSVVKRSLRGASEERGRSESEHQDVESTTQERRAAIPQRSPLGSGKFGQTHLILSSAGGVTAPLERSETQSGEPLLCSAERKLRRRIGRIRKHPKSTDALERDGSGRSSDDARGQHNPSGAKDPWVRVALKGWRSRTRNGLTRSGLTGTSRARSQQERRRSQTEAVAEGRAALNHARADLKPYWGKPAVRNFRGDAGNGMMAARGGHSAERVEQLPGLAKPEHHRACFLLDAGKTEPKNPDGHKPSEKVRQLQRQLWVAAKRAPGRRFHALYGHLWRSDVLQEAWKRVRRNRGAAGVDSQSLSSVEQYGVERFVAELGSELQAGEYRAQVVKRRYIPKADGRQRPLGIPTVRDRVVQMAVKLVLEPIFEADFLPCSYGFRPNRSATMALETLRKIGAKGGHHLLDAGIRDYFGSIDHEKLLKLVARRISDRRMLKLLRQWLEAGEMEDGAVSKTVAGTPQGGVISPLLSNIYLHVLDRLWTQQRAPWGTLVRYADDFVVMCRTRKDCEQAEADRKAS